jgi:hypothetical protein
MTSDGEQFSRIASAEKQLCEQAGPLLAEIIRGVEDRYGVKIAELRVTMDRPDPANGWSAANCVIVREDKRFSGASSKPTHWGAMGASGAGQAVAVRRSAIRDPRSRNPSPAPTAARIPSLRNVFRQ